MDAMEQVMLFASVLSMIVIALVQLIKVSTDLPKKAIPLIGLLVGLGVGAIAYPFTELDLVLRLWAGGFAGLSSTGLFELVFNKNSGSTKDPKQKPFNPYS
jgi:hypothetical protein